MVEARVAARAIERLCKRRVALTKSIVQFKHDVGKCAMELIDARMKKSMPTVYELGTRLDVTNSQISTFCRFFKLVKPRELRWFQSNDWGWGAISRLLSVEDRGAAARIKRAYTKTRDYAALVAAVKREVCARTRPRRQKKVA